MAMVTIPAESRRISDAGEIRVFLADHGINYETWPLEDRVDPAAPADDILAAFERGEAPPLQVAETDYRAPSLARAEWEHINRVLSDCGGNISEAARRLNIHRRSLQRKLQKYPPRE